MRFLQWIPHRRFPLISQHHTADMAPIIDSPYAHSGTVKKTVDDIANLRDESLAADKAIANAKYSATDLAQKYKDNITALAGLPAAIDKFAEVGSSFPSMRFLPCLPDWKLYRSSINFCGQHVLMVRELGLVISVVMNFSFFQSPPTHTHLSEPQSS